MLTDKFQKSSNFFDQQQVAPGCLIIRNWECFCEEKGVQENFLQENTGTDKIKIYNKTSSYYIYSWVLTIVVQLVSCDSLQPQGL